MTQTSSPRLRAWTAGLCALTLTGLAGSALAASKVYTTDADFDLGVLSGVNHDAPNNNQLQLNKVGTTFPVMWIANAGEDTVSKFDTNLNVEVARYRTWFGPTGQAGSRGIHGAYSGPAPSRSRRRSNARRLLATVGVLPMVIIGSTTRRSSFALGSVVLIASCLSSETVMLRSIAKRWLLVRLSLRSPKR